MNRGLLIGTLGILVLLSGIAAFLLTSQVLSQTCPTDSPIGLHCWWSGLSYNGAEPNGGGGFTTPLSAPFILLVVLGFIIIIVGLQLRQGPTMPSVSG